ncbi:hypothetical protein EJ04DRAFT_423217 [Polyplosphaeria fusca]|uniref:F-box domain-containing protein n=1 Tax=Polyplosphaeria fusca TaxID=682080 RepID=A0A9P4V936_9PLEO|nr:hypothetical protein EJ04DRAFT_423217 [Polyplosphaeria fusca]
MPETARNEPRFATYLPNELLLDILSYFPECRLSQGTLANFVLVCRQWYDAGIGRLYQAPYLVGKKYDMFVRTVCPSVILHVRKSELAGLVKVLNLSHIVHQGNKSTTARLLGRTKPSLEIFVAPQASFAVNCWASLSKCSRLRTLDLSLVSESISYQSLHQTMRQLSSLENIYLPRCNSSSDDSGLGPHDPYLSWPPNLKELGLAGNVHGRLIWGLRDASTSFPPTLHSLRVEHAPRLSVESITSLFEKLENLLTNVVIRDLPLLRHGEMNDVLNVLPNLTSLTIATDYIDLAFGLMEESYTEADWAQSKPLQKLYLVSSVSYDVDPNLAFQPTDMFDLIDRRFLGRLRELRIQKSIGWGEVEDGAQVDAVELALRDLDRENWYFGRWHYADVRGKWSRGMTYDKWRAGTRQGREMGSKMYVETDR